MVNGVGSKTLNDVGSKTLRHYSRRHDCPLTWMFHGHKINYKINRLQERALRLIYNAHISSFEELLSKDGTFTIHEQNIRNLAIEMFKALNDLSTLDFFRTISVK